MPKAMPQRKPMREGKQTKFKEEDHLIHPHPAFGNVCAPYSINNGTLNISKYHPRICMADAGSGQLCGKTFDKASSLSQLRTHLQLHHGPEGNGFKLITKSSCENTVDELIWSKTILQDFVRTGRWRRAKFKHNVREGPQSIANIVIALETKAMMDPEFAERFPPPYGRIQDESENERDVPNASDDEEVACEGFSNISSKRSTLFNGLHPLEEQVLAFRNGTDSSCLHKRKEIDVLPSPAGIKVKRARITKLSSYKTLMDRFMGRSAVSDDPTPSDDDEPCMIKQETKPDAPFIPTDDVTPGEPDIQPAKSSYCESAEWASYLPVI